MDFFHILGEQLIDLSSILCYFLDELGVGLAYLLRWVFLLYLSFRASFVLDYGSCFLVS